MALVVGAARLRQQRRRFPAVTTAVKDEARDGDFVTPDEVWNRDTGAKSGRHSSLVQDEKTVSGDACGSHWQDTAAPRLGQSWLTMDNIVL